MIRLLVFAVSSVGAFSQETHPTKPAQAYLVPEAYEVYSAILPDQWTWRDAKASALVIRAETVSHEMCLKPDAKSAELLDPAIADFVKVNSTPSVLQQMFNISKPYELIDSETLMAPFKAAGVNGWKSFNAIHPNSAGWIELSAVGFIEDKSIAVVYVGHSCGGLCGGGGFTVLRKIGGIWKPLKWKGGACSWAS